MGQVFAFDPSAEGKDDTSSILETLNLKHGSGCSLNPCQSDRSRPARGAAISSDRHKSHSSQEKLPHQKPFSRAKPDFARLALSRIVANSRIIANLRPANPASVTHPQGTALALAAAHDWHDTGIDVSAVRSFDDRSGRPVPGRALLDHRARQATDSGGLRCAGGQSRYRHGLVVSSGDLGVRLPLHHPTPLLRQSERFQR